MATKKIKIHVQSLLPGMSFIQPLYSLKDEKILESRIFLTSKKIKEISKQYGNIIYYEIPYTESMIPEAHVHKALDHSREIFDEIISTEKLSQKGYHKAEKVIEEFVSDLESTEIQALNLLKELKNHDEYQYLHQVNVGILATVFARKLSVFTLEEIKQVGLGSFLIDIGKSRIDKQLLNKKETLTITEMQKMRRHPQLGYELLKEIKGIQPIILQTVLFHHEKYNNRGYYGLPYKNLPLPPKLAGVCDIFDALTSSRPHRDAFPYTTSLKFMVNTINTQFDYSLISNFINQIGPLLNRVQVFYSRYDFCELNTREIAVIKDFSPTDYLKPTILIFCMFERLGKKLEVKFYRKPIEINLHKDVNRYITKFIINKRQIALIRSHLGRRGMLEEYFIDESGDKNS
jgi:HD-GYP domain-containing protein (c-di-GMP phosphodiesterase class II)